MSEASCEFVPVRLSLYKPENLSFGKLFIIKALKGTVT